MTFYKFLDSKIHLADSETLQTKRQPLEGLITKCVMLANLSGIEPYHGPSTYIRLIMERKLPKYDYGA